MAQAQATQVAALLLDLDGTLVDSEPWHFRAHERFLASVGIVPTHAELLGNIGRGDRAFYADLMRLRGCPGDLAAWLRGKDAALAELYRSAPLPQRPGALALLTAAAARGISAVVVTNSPRALCQAALLSAGLSHLLPLRVCHDDTAEHKPHPAPYQRAAARLGVPPTCCLAIEDSPNGVAAARAAGCRTLAVPGLVPEDALRAAGAQRLCADLAAAIPELQGPA